MDMDKGRVESATESLCVPLGSLGVNHLNFSRVSMFTFADPSHLSSYRHLFR